MILPVVGRRRVHWARNWSGRTRFCSLLTVEIFWPSNGGIGWYLKDHLELNRRDEIYAGLLLSSLSWLGSQCRSFMLFDNECSTGRTLRRVRKSPRVGHFEGIWSTAQKGLISKVFPLETWQELTEFRELPGRGVSEKLEADSANSSSFRPYILPNELRFLGGISAGLLQNLAQRDISVRAGLKGGRGRCFVCEILV